MEKDVNKATLGSIRKLSDTVRENYYLPEWRSEKRRATGGKGLFLLGCLPALAYP
jgi:hypothetical protein